MNKAQIEAMKTAYEKLKTEGDGLLAKSDLTQEDTVRLGQINTEKAALVEAVKAAKSSGESDDAFDQITGDAMAKFEHPSAPKTTAKVLGMDPNAPKENAHVQRLSNGGLQIDLDGEVRSDEERAKTATPEYLKAYAKWIRGKGVYDALDREERKVLNEGNDQEGGFLVPEQFIARLLQRKPAPTRLVSKLTVIPCSRDALTIPKVVYNAADDHIYTTGIRATLTGEIPASSTAHRATEPVFGNVVIPIGTWMLSLAMSNDFLEDSAIPVMNWISDKFGETKDLLFENQAINGTGVGRNPKGILMAPGTDGNPDVVLSGTADNIDADQIRAIPFNVAEQYMDGATWVMNRKETAQDVALLKDTADRYLFHMGGIFPGLAERVPDTLGGHPITYSAFMPDPADGAYPIIFGDPAGYILASRVDMSIQVLREAYAELNQVVLLGRLRFGGALGEEWRMVIGKSDNA